MLCWTPFVFSLWGFVGAAIWVASMLCAFVGIQGLGYGTAVATWASITMTVAFLWGTLVFGEAPSNIGGAVAALLVLGVGVAGVATAQSPSWQPSDNGESDSLFQALNVNGDSEAGVGVGVGVGVGEAQDEGEGEAGGKTTTPSKTSKLAGWCGAVGCGLTNGSLMVPFHYFSEAHSGSNASIAVSQRVGLSERQSERQFGSPQPIILHFNPP